MGLKLSLLELRFCWVFPIAFALASISSLREIRFLCLSNNILFVGFPFLPEAYQNYVWVFWFGVGLDLLPMGFLVVFSFVIASEEFYCCRSGCFKAAKSLCWMIFWLVKAFPDRVRSGQRWTSQVICE